VWPSSTFSVSPVDESHTRTNLSHEPETIRLPSLENATDEITPPAQSVINGMSPRCALMKLGILGKCLLQF
jgi:hypothetical protein